MFRLIIIWVVSVFMLTAGSAVAGDDALPGVLPANHSVVAHLRAGTEQHSKQEYAVAVTLLQKVLETSSAETFVPQSVSARGQLIIGRKMVMVDAHDDARRMLDSVPREFRPMAQPTSGTRALELFLQAEKMKDLQQMSVVARRWPHTDAGAKALVIVAEKSVVQGQYIHAIRMYELLEKYHYYPLLEPLVAYHFALAVYRSGGNNERFDFRLELLRRNLGKNTLELNGKRLKYEELVAEIKKVPPQIPDTKQPVVLPAFRENGLKRGKKGTLPNFEEVWRHELASERTAAPKLREALEQVAEKGQPILPGSQPVSVEIKTEAGVLIPLAGYRQYMGTLARTLKTIPAEELKNGDVFWASESPWSLEKMLRDPASLNQLNSWLRDHVTARKAPEVLVENSITGCNSTDGKFFFAIDDFMVATTPVAAREKTDGPAGRLTDALHHNRLQSIDLDSGKLQWEIGNANLKDKLTDSFFLSAPLVHDKKLHVLNEQHGTIRLVKLDAATGNLLEVIPLLRVGETYRSSVYRQLDAAHVVYTGGVFVCPSNAGAVVGVEGKSGQTLWVYPYVRNSTPQNGRWRYTCPLPAGDKLVLASADSRDVACLELASGKELWKSPRRLDDWYVAGVLKDAVVIVGGTSCRGLALDSGKVLWETDTATPAGLGAADGDRYFLPVAAMAKTGKPGIMVLDFANKGKVTARIEAPKDAVVGNLSFFEGHLLSQSALAIAVYPLR